MSGASRLPSRCILLRCASDVHVVSLVFLAVLNVRAFSVMFAECSNLLLIGAFGLFEGVCLSRFLS